MNNHDTHLSVRPAANLTTSPQRKSPFEGNTADNPLGTPWTVKFIADILRVMSVDEMVIGIFNRNYSKLVWPWIDAAVHGTPAPTTAEPLPPEISREWIYRRVENVKMRLSPQFQLVAENSGVILFTSNIQFSNINDAEAIEAFGVRMAELINTLRLKGRVVPFAQIKCSKTANTTALTRI